MKTSELSGKLLALWVGRAAGADFGPDYDQGEYVITGGHSGHTAEVYAPHENWAQGGPLIKRFGLGVLKRYAPTYGPVKDGEEWGALTYNGSKEAVGLTPLIAAMRVLVAMTYGDEVPE